MVWGIDAAGLAAKLNVPESWIRENCQTIARIKNREPSLDLYSRLAVGGLERKGNIAIRRITRGITGQNSHRFGNQTHPLRAK